MASKKKTMTYITDEAERMAMYEKLKKDLLRRISEIKRIHGVDACAVLYRPDGSGPEVCPSWASAETTLTRLNMLPEADIKVWDQDSFNRQKRMKKKSMKKVEEESVSGEAAATPGTKET